MAQEPGQAKSKSLHQLRQEIAHSRDRCARDLSGLRYELDFPLKFRKSFQRQTVWWVAAAAVIGVGFAVMPARTGKGRARVMVKKGTHAQEGILGAGLAIAVLKLALPLLKPVITGFISKKIGRYAAGSSPKR